MEKLQKALQKARDQRTSHNPPLGQGSAAKSTDTADLWAALPEYKPNKTVLETNRIVTNTINPMTTHFDILRTKTILAMRKNGWTRLGITSPTASCGKITTACNLALGLARQPDTQTALFELDLRKPTIASTLQLPTRPDISKLLSNEVSFADQAVRYGENVAISAAVHPTTDPTSVLLSRVSTDVLKAVEKDYALDIMIFDLPPLLVSDEVSAFLKELDCVLMVAKAEKTLISQIDTCEREIAEHTNVLGVVLNQYRHADPRQFGYGTYAE